jgi:NAD dependent epimerase/dehydratase family enzyme
MRLLLLGCSGFVGRELVPFLLELGHSLTLISRTERPFPSLMGDRLVALRLDPSEPTAWERDDLRRVLAEAEGVVNLAGEPIAEKRWTPQHLQLLQDSRVTTTRCLVDGLPAATTRCACKRLGGGLLRHRSGGPLHGGQCGGL